MVATDLPDALLLHVLVLEDPEPPVGVLAVNRLLGEHVPAGLRRSTVRRNVDHGLQLHVIVEAPRLRAFRSVRQQKLANAPWADVHAAAADLDRAVGREQGRGGAPQLLVGIEAVAAL
jgi:hypothetical protein